VTILSAVADSVTIASDLAGSPQAQEISRYFESWHDFFLMAGTAAVTLLGLLFVSLSFHLEVLLHESRAHLLEVARQAMLNFIGVLIISLAFLAPGMTTRALGMNLFVISSIFLVFTHTSIVRVFFITAATFGALSLYGYTTKRDMSGMGSFLFMGLIGIVIASLVNLFLASSVLQFVVSVVGVLVFAGLTAWDTQRLKNDYIYGYASQGGDIAERAAITGALSLYLNFINLFTLLLQLLGQRD
jgi:FtsH-binding integral membrane protein